MNKFKKGDNVRPLYIVTFEKIQSIIATVTCSYGDKIDVEWKDDKAARFYGTKSLDASKFDHYAVK